MTLGGGLRARPKVSDSGMFQGLAKCFTVRCLLEESVLESELYLLPEAVERNLGHGTRGPGDRDSCRCCRFSCRWEKTGAAEAGVRPDWRLDADRGWKLGAAHDFRTAGPQSLSHMSKSFVASFRRHLLTSLYMTMNTLHDILHHVSLHVCSGVPESPLQTWLDLCRGRQGRG